jgi:N-formylglutamate amidohydrolase
VHALQIELNRALYLDEQTLRPHQGFPRLAENLRSLFQSLAAWGWPGFL